MTPPILAILVALIALGFGAWAWRRMPPDRTGPHRVAPDAGVQRRLARALRDLGRADAPDPNQIAADGPPRPTRPAQRALEAIVRREAIETHSTPAEAYARLVERTTDPLLAAFLQGRRHRLVRAYWRAHYPGRAWTFPFWFRFVAWPRYGRRYLYFAALAGALAQWRIHARS